MRNTPRANIINALHALENGKPAAEVTAWLQDAIDSLNPLERPARNPVIEGYTIERNGNITYVRDAKGDEYAHCVQYPESVVVNLRDRFPVEVKTMYDAIRYIKSVINLKQLLDAKST